MQYANTPEILSDRLAAVTRLSNGSHDPTSGEMCAMEAAAYIVGEPWSDHPKCVCPVIAAFMRSWNDNLSDDNRTRLLLPLIPTTIGTRGSKALEARRATMAADWYVRTFTPAWLRLAGLTARADALAGMPEVTSFARTPSIRSALEAAQKDAKAAESAAWSAAESAARSAARSAAWSAAWSALKPTCDSLQASAVELVARMCAATEADIPTVAA